MLQTTRIAKNSSEKIETFIGSSLMSPPQSVLNVVHKSNHLWGQGSIQHPKINPTFYGSQSLVTPFGTANTKITM